jgi:hypothetical protein
LLAIVPSSWITCAKCSVAWPKYTMRPLPSSKLREITPGVSSRKSLQLRREAIGMLRWNSPSKFSTLLGLLISSIGDSDSTVTASSSRPTLSVMSSAKVLPARISTPACLALEKPDTSAVIE